ncbi:MAG TPA: DUF885 family protein, partial [Urbifossiella sp.]
MFRLILTLPILLGTAVMALPAADPPANAEDAKLAKMFREWLDEEFKLHPMFATQQGNHDYDDRMDDLFPKARKRERDRILETMMLLNSLKRNELSRNSQIDAAIWVHSIKNGIWSEENDNRFEFDPRAYGEYISDSVFLLFTQSTLSRERNVQNAARRIAAIPKVIEAAKASLKNPPKILTEVAMKRNLGAIAFYEKDIYEFAKETPGSEPLGTPCRAAVKALKEYQTWLEKDLLPRSTGEWRLGKEKFAKKLELELDAGLTA